MPLEPEVFDAHHDIPTNIHVGRGIWEATPSATLVTDASMEGCVVQHGSLLFLVSDEDERSLTRSVVDDDGSQECIPSRHGRTTT
jgi:hypothetical protein